VFCCGLPAADKATTAKNNAPPTVSFFIVAVLQRDQPSSDWRILLPQASAALEADPLTLGATSRLLDHSLRRGLRGHALRRLLHVLRLGRRAQVHSRVVCLRRYRVR